MCTGIYHVHDSRQSEKYTDDPWSAHNLSQKDEMNAEKEEPNQPNYVKDLCLLENLLFAG